MKFIIQRDQLISSVQDVMKAISSRTVIPILTGIKIEAKKHGISLTGSDSDISIESYIPAEEDDVVNVEQIEEGSIVLQAKYFPDIVKKLPEKTVEIECDESLKVTIRSGKAEFNLNGQDAEEYPQLPKIQTDNSFEMPIDLLKSMIKQTVFAVSTMETRPILTGVNVNLTNNTLSLVATDSHRLASREVPISDTNIEFKNVVVPGKSLNELNKILDDAEEKVEISVTNNQILFRTKHLYFLSRLLDGNYPETSRLIPEQSKTKIQVKTKELLSTIDRASLLAREERNNVVRLTTQGDNLIEITSNSPEVGNVTEDITVHSIEGEELKISFSSKYMIDALKAIEYDEVIISFTGAMRPFIMRPVDDDSILQLILPVRTY
ncbi:DNA polymerase III subunit beta [Oceanobacillus piezotolerans]|uniref:Beta sliding clamp n=1 Tax=Oceanobacillus piezotolerans TaxID=2448030 RepID=A0A498D4K5_9BACI|nr:DNA polymerase III subunit beta [Oceanobacillus piezotolerans]RLL41731.1 DNA polymerase III subunit beta [Oceanobacillus piezotolerans]